MINRLFIALECSRIFSLPMTIMSWLIIFAYSLTNSGNFWLGILTLAGLSLAHLGTNLIDDYIDYKYLIKMVNFNKEEYLKNSQKTKCRYILNGILNEKDILILVGIYFGAAFLIGLFLFFKCGIGVLYFALAGGIIGLSYPIISRFFMSELAVALAYGPALFGGVYYVMTGAYSKEVFILSIPSMIMAVILLYIHTVMDFEFDTNENKKTIANSFDSQLDSLIILKILLILSYVSIILLCIFDITDWQVMLTYITIPLAIDLYKSLCDYSCTPDEIPDKKWYHFPMENLELFEKRGEAAFMMRMYQARNLTIYFSIALLAGIFFSLAI